MSKPVKKVVVKRKPTNNKVWLNPFEHALKRPDTYIGSVVTSEEEVWVYDSESRQAQKRTIDYNPGLFNIIREIGSNAIDNVWRSADTEYPMKKITFDVSEKGEISITNDGVFIPVEKQEFAYTNHRTNETRTEVLYPAQVHFGEMHAGSNFDDSVVRKTSGRNGMGSKATNVFSKKFVVDHADPVRGKRLVLEFSDNATVRNKPKVTSRAAKSVYTKITFTPDYERFDFEFNQDFVDLLHLYAYEIAMVTGVSVRFNGNLIKVPSLEKYAKLFHPNAKLAYISSPTGDECVVVQIEPEADETSISPNISYVNGIHTTKGGIHVNKWHTTIIGGFVRAFNNKKRTGEKKELKTSAKQTSPYLFLFVKSEVDKPDFGTQTKDKFTGIFVKKGNKFVSEAKHDLFTTPRKGEEFKADVESLINKLLKWDFVTELENKLLSKTVRSSITKSKLSSRPNIKKLSDANFAGTKRSEECVLHVMEGDSAKTFVTRGISSLPNGHDLNGAFPLKGKFLNVQDATKAQIEKNEEVQNLRRAIGLLPNVDYSVEANRKLLRYGKVRIVADADDDGIHIRGLVLLFFYVVAPELIELGFVDSLSVTVAKVNFPGKRKPLYFYSNPEFKEWYAKQQKLGNTKFKVDYQKGLASIPVQDAPMYFKNPKILAYIRDIKADEYMDLAFKKKGTAKEIKERSQKRKEWIREGVKTHRATYIFDGDIRISIFINEQLMIYNVMTLRRALPCFYDGFKESLRKVFYAMMARNYTDPHVVERAAGAVSELTAYHHGSVSIQGAMIKMANNFVGSNNIPLLTSKGEVGTRLKGGKDAGQGRYVSVMVSKIAKAIYMPVDEPLLEQRTDENKLVEFVNYLPIIPMVLINGAVQNGSAGMASGFSTSIPNYNPIDVINWVRAWLNDEESEPLIPWYDGFKGEVEVIRNTKGIPVKCITRGILQKESGGWWSIPELPVGLWTNNFKGYLDEMVNGVPGTGKSKSKPAVLKKYTDHSTVNTVDFKILPTKEFTPDMNTKDNFKILESSVSLTNMVAVDENDFPIQFDTVEDIMEVFCPKRLSLYKARKRYYLEAYKQEHIKANNRYKYIKMVKDGKLNLHQLEEDVNTTLESLGFTKLESGKRKEPTFDYLLDMATRSITIEKMEALKREAGNLKEKFQILKLKSPKDLWLEDLDNLEKEYKVYLKNKIV